MSSTKAPPRVGKAVADAIANGAPNIDLSKLPDLKDMSVDSITANVHAINSLCENKRMKFVFEKLVESLHNFARDVALTSDEWMAAIQFLTKTGQTCTDLRQEFILLSDILGLSALVDGMNHPKPQGATESTVLGPFFTEDAKDIPAGESIASEGKGEVMYVKGKVTNTKGEPLANVAIETWETDADGLYDTQYEGREFPDCRGRVHTNAEGVYEYKAVKPVAYPIPNDGPVGKLLKQLNRHVFRPAHLHMTFTKPGYAHLITALYFTGDDYLNSDAVFGVKSSLIETAVEIEDEEEAKKLGFKAAPFWLLERDFVLVTDEEDQVEQKKTLKNYYDSL